MKPHVLSMATIAVLLSHAGCGDTLMQGRSYVIADESTRHAQALWVNQMPVTSPFPVPFEPIEDTVEIEVAGKRERVWGEGGQALKVSLKESSSLQQAVLSLQRFTIGRDVRPDAILVDAEPSVTPALVHALSATNVLPLGFGNAVQLEGPEMLMRSAWATIPNTAELAFSLVEQPTREEGPARLVQEKPTREPLIERPQALVPWEGLHMQGDNILRVDASGGVQVLDEGGCLLDTGSEVHLALADGALLFRGRPLGKFSVDLEKNDEP